MTIGENIKKLREAKGMTQEQLAEKINVSRPYITQLERGSKILNVLTGEILAKALGCTLTELLELCRK